MKPVHDVKVLIVEDDPFFQRVLLKRLASEGYKVIAANDGREGMKAIVTFEPDLVLSDWMMPEVDGLELCQSVKTGLGEAAPYFILLTAKGEISSRLLGLETGADDYLVKPCDQGELMARVRAGLRIVLLTQELRATVAKLKHGGAPGADSDGLVTICPDCRQVLAPGGEWQPLETWLEQAQGHHFARAHCPRCRDSAAA